MKALGLVVAIGKGLQLVAVIGISKVVNAYAFAIGAFQPFYIPIAVIGIRASVSTPICSGGVVGCAIQAV